jgi:hypothetical protein
MGWLWLVVAAAVVAWPWLLALGSPSPLFELALAFALPAVGVFLAARPFTVASPAAGRLRWWAHAATVAPIVVIGLRVLFHTVATQRMVWLALFAPPLAIGLLRTFTAAGAAVPSPPPAPARLAFVLKLHRSGASLMLAFLALHLASHVSAFYSLDLNVRVAAWMRTIYKQPLVEALLLSALPFQIGTGLWLVRHAWHGAPHALERLQVASGLTLALFIAVHAWATAVLMPDLTFYGASGGARGVVPDPVFFAYYVLGVAGVFVHLAGGMRSRVGRRRGPAPAKRWAYGVLAGGAAVTLVVALALAGVHVRGDRHEGQRRTMREVAQEAAPRQ